MQQRFTLDRQSFEQFLAAISLFQPLQRAAAQRGSEPLFFSLVETLRRAESGTLTQQDALARVAELALRVVGGETAGLWLFQRKCDEEVGEEMIGRALAGKNIEDSGIVAALLPKLESGGAFQENPPPRLDLTRTLNGRRGAVGSVLAVAILPGRHIAGGLAVFSSDATAFREKNYSHLRLLAGLAQHILNARASRIDLVDAPELSTAQKIAVAPFLAPQARLSHKRGASEPFLLQEPDPAVSPREEIGQPDRVTPVPGGRGSGVRDALLTAESKSISKFAGFHTAWESLYGLRLRVHEAVRNTLAGSYVVRMNWRTLSDGMQALMVLVIMSFFVGILTGGTRSLSAPSMKMNTTAEAGTPQPSGKPGMTAMPAPSMVLASTRSAAAPRVTSHLQITDRNTREQVTEMSRFEIRTVRRGAEAGDDEAALQLGMLYELGQGVRQSCDRAAGWVKRAAQGGNADAEYNLGLRYRDGDGLAADATQAEYWLRKAAAHKNRDARAILAVMATTESH